jgi:hypothetical protein
MSESICGASAGFVVKEKESPPTRAPEKRSRSALKRDAGFKRGKELTEKVGYLVASAEPA